LAACSDKQDLAAPKAAPHSANAVGIPLPPPRPSPTDFVEITAGDYHTCARQYNGNVYCWGSATFGQVGGLPSTPCSPAARVYVVCFPRPARVVSPAENFYTATQITAGSNHTCALAPGGAAYCWGEGNNGELGLGGFTTGTYEPTRVGTGTFSSISAGY